MIDARGVYDVSLVTGEECISMLREFVEQHESERWTNPAVAMAEEVAQLLDEHVVQGLTRLYGAWLDETRPVQSRPCLPPLTRKHPVPLPPANTEAVKHG